MADLQIPATLCCLKSDGTTQPTPGCACPDIEVVYSTDVFYCQMVGFAEVGTRSSPPRAYRHFTPGGGGWTYKTQDYPTAGDVQQTAAASKSSGYGFNASTGALENSSDTDTEVVYTSSPPLSSSTVDYQFLLALLVRVDESGVSGPTNGSSVYCTFEQFNPPRPVCSVDSQTQFTLNMATYLLGHDSVTAGSLSCALIDEDLEDDAVSRALSGSPASTSGGVAAPDSSGLLDYAVASVYERRSDDGINFYRNRTMYAMLFSNLVPGLTYRWTRVIVQRTAKFNFGDDSLYGSTWTVIATQTDTFTADGPQKLIGGSWVDTNSDGLISPDEVTPTTELGVTNNYEQAIMSIFCEVVSS